MTEGIMATNRKHKDTMFTKLFSDPEKLLVLYNAVSGSNILPGTPIEISTLEDVLFIDRINDIAFVMDGRIVILIEHQSTINENMPLRLLLYVARVYEKIIDNAAIFKSKLLKLPRPDFIVLYNGQRAFPDERVMRLSDAYDELPSGLESARGLLELEARVLNVNEGRNAHILEKDETLYGYAHFIGRVRDCLSSGMDLEEAITEAVKRCINAGILADFLSEHSSEVINMLTYEWNIEIARSVWESEAREEGREEGRVEGREEGRVEERVEVAKNLLQIGVAIEIIAKSTGLSEEEIKRLGLEP
jgi:predicted transposase YdaD